MVLVEREVLQHELETVFDAQTTETLLRVLDKVATQVYADTVPRFDFSRLERLVEQIAAEQVQLSQKLQKLTEQVQLLLEAQRRNEERFSRIEADIGDLKTDVGVLKTDVAVLKTDVGVLKTDVGHLRGKDLERTYREKAPAYFGRLLRKVRIVDLNRLRDELESQLSEEELHDVLLTDLIVTGRPQDREQDGDLYLAVEVSAVVDRHDVERAQHRAALLQKAGFSAIPVAAGYELTEGAEEEARAQRVALIMDGGVLVIREA